MSNEKENQCNGRHRESQAYCRKANPTTCRTS
nr:MAG TPA: hypothetical protein [Herelleviridae sp.]